MYELSEDLAQFDVSIVTSRYQLLRSFETPFCYSLEHFPKHLFAIFLQLRILNAHQNNSTITEKHVTYVIKTKPHTCFDIARKIALIRNEEGFNSTFSLVLSFLITNSRNLSCYIKTSVWFCIYIQQHCRIISVSMSV